MTEVANDYSPAVIKFYENWGKFALLTLEQAICVILGMNPDTIRKKHHHAPKDPLFPFNQTVYNRTKAWATSSIEARELIPDYKVHSYAAAAVPIKFKPNNFITWGIGKGIMPHPLLLENTGYNDRTKQIGADDCDPIIAHERTEFQLNRFYEGRGNELNKVIEDVFRKLMFDSQKLPNATDVFNSLKSCYKESYHFISDMPASPRKIVWMSSNGSKNMLDKRFINIVSEITTDYQRQFITYVTP